MSAVRRHLRLTLIAIAAAALTAIISVAGRAHATTSAARAAQTSTKPSIVLVHGAWANVGSWDGVIQPLQAEGYTVYTPPNPLLSL